MIKSKRFKDGQMRLEFTPHIRMVKMVGGVEWVNSTPL